MAAKQLQAAIDIAVLKHGVGVGWDEILRKPTKIYQNAGIKKHQED